MRFARTVFTLAAVWGFVVLPPMYFLEQKIARDTPPAITHPEYFYGFVGVGIAFQLVFLLIGRDPVRYRPMMLPSMIEKLSFAIACFLLQLSRHIPPQMFAAGMIDLVLGILFVTAYLKTAVAPRSNVAAA